MKNLRKLTLVTIVSLMISFLITILGTPLFTPGATAADSALPNTLVIAASNSPDKSSANYVCDGVDDQKEINSAINKLAGKAGTVELLSGIFIISKPIVVKENLTLLGQANDTTIFLKSGSNCNIIENPWNKATTNVTIRDMRLDGNRSQQKAANNWTSMQAIQIRTNGTNSLYENLTIENMWSGGIRHVGGNSIITSNTFRNCTWAAIAVNDSFGVEISNNTIIDCATKFTDGGRGSSIHAYNGGNHVISFNYIERGGKMEQIGAWNSPKNEIANNTLVDGLWMGIAPFSDGATIKDNTITNAAENAIDTRGKNNMLIQGNTIDTVIGNRAGNYEHSGICVNGDGHKVIDNNIANVGGTGIQVDSLFGTYISGNNIKNCGIKDTLGRSRFYAGIVIQMYDVKKRAINSGTVIENNTLWDDQAVPTTQYGILLLPGQGYIDNLVIKGNVFSTVDTGIKIWTLERIRNSSFTNNLLAMVAG